MRAETREQWRACIAAWHASGLTCRDYAERAGLNRMVSSRSRTYVAVATACEHRR